MVGTIDVTDQRQSNLLEVAAGTGQHAVHFAAALAHVTWWPCELAREPRQYRGLQVSVSHHKSHAITAAGCDAGWLAVGGTEPSEADFILCCNMIHIAPWAACLGLLEGAGGKLTAWRQADVVWAVQTARCGDRSKQRSIRSSLKARNPDWGLRLLEEVVEAASPHGLELERVIEMPANNLSVVFKRTGA
jgi:hypothetical protein